MYIYMCTHARPHIHRHIRIHVKYFAFRYLFLQLDICFCNIAIYRGAHSCNGYEDLSHKSWNSLEPKLKPRIVFQKGLVVGCGLKSFRGTPTNKVCLSNRRFRSAGLKKQWNQVRRVPKIPLPLHFKSILKFNSIFFQVATSNQDEDHTTPGETAWKSLLWQTQVVLR